MGYDMNMGNYSLCGIFHDATRSGFWLISLFTIHSTTQCSTLYNSVNPVITDRPLSRPSLAPPLPLSPLFAPVTPTEMREQPYYASYAPGRLLIHGVVTSKYFDLAIAAVIGLNVVTMAMEYYKMPPVRPETGP